MGTESPEWASVRMGAGRKGRGLAWRDASHRLASTPDVSAERYTTVPVGLEIFNLNRNTWM